MGAILRAWDEDLRRTLAMKVALTRAGSGETGSEADASDSRLLGRFLEEAQITGQLEHPNIVQVFDFGTMGEDLVLVMELVDGSNVSRLLRTAPPESPIPWDVALHIAYQTAQALDYAHHAVDDQGESLEFMHRAGSENAHRVQRCVGIVENRFPGKDEYPDHPAIGGLPGEYHTLDGLKRFLDELRRTAPGIARAVAAHFAGKPRAWSRAERLSVDYAVMERLDSIASLLLVPNNKVRASRPMSSNSPSS